MDFSAWSPSHTILVVVMVVVTAIGFVGQGAVLFYRTRQLEKRQDKTDNRIESVRLEMNKQISEVRLEMNQGFSDLRGEMNQRLSDVQSEIGDVRSDMNQQDEPEPYRPPEPAPQLK